MSRRASWGALVEFRGEHGGRTADAFDAAAKGGADR